MSSKQEDENMTPEERLEWLRSHGVEIETSEERKVKVELKKEGMKDEDNLEKISYVLLPSDSSKPLKELYFYQPKETSERTDPLLLHLKPYFTQNTNELDVNLLHQASNTTNLIGTEGTPTPNISEETLKKVAAEGNVESFPLVKPMQSNKHTGVYFYLDEIGMAKRLPLNRRATMYAQNAGYNPAPQFYGDVFFGRVQTLPYIHHVNFSLGIDTALDASWLQKAAMENLTTQMEMNELLGKNQLQPGNAGEEGIDKVEDGYTWTQNEEEIEIKLHLKDEKMNKKGIKVIFKRKNLIVFVKGSIPENDANLRIDLFDNVDTDDCTWTLENDKNKGTQLVITLTKNEPNSWPRITF